VSRKYDTFFIEHLQQYLILVQESENWKHKMFLHLHLTELNLNAKLQAENTTMCYFNGCVQMNKLRAD
jgi:hypothetical protein